MTQCPMCTKNGIENDLYDGAEVRCVYCNEDFVIRIVQAGISASTHNVDGIIFNEWEIDDFDDLDEEEL